MSDNAPEYYVPRKQIYKSLTLHGSMILDGLFDRLHISFPCLGPEIHSSIKGKCSSPVILTEDTTLCMTVHKKGGGVPAFQILPKFFA